MSVCGSVHVSPGAQGDQSCGIPRERELQVAVSHPPSHHRWSTSSSPLTRLSGPPIFLLYFLSPLSFFLGSLCSVSLPPTLLTACWVPLGMLFSWASVRNHRKSYHILRTGLSIPWSRSPNRPSHNDTKSGKGYLLRLPSSPRGKESCHPSKRDIHSPKCHFRGRPASV